MKQQVIYHVGGGIAKSNYKNYLFYLACVFKKTLGKKVKKWHQFYEEKLGESYSILRHSGKNKHYASYYIWKEEFEKDMFSFTHPIILVGHSLGGSFILKYLSETDHEIKIKKIFLIAPAFKDCDTESLGDFNFDKSLEGFKKYQSITKIYHSVDDPVVPFDDYEDIITALPHIEKQTFEDKGHFTSLEFSELMNDIQK